MGLYTISTSESELMDRTYMVTPTLTAWPETQSYICGGQLIDHWSDWSDQLVEARPCLFIQILSWFYPDYIQVLSRFYPDFFETHLIQILSLFHLDKICMKSGWNPDKIWIKGHMDGTFQFTTLFWPRILVLILFFFGVW